MSTTTAGPSHLDISGTASIPFSRLVRIELRKSYDTRAGFWLLMTIAIVVFLAELIALLVTVINDDAIQFGDFVGVAAFLTSILLPVLGIMLVTTEWSQRTAMVTFALEPRRARVVLAKLVTGILLTFATAAAAIVVGVVCTGIYGAFRGHADWTFGWNYFFGFLVVQSLAMIGGFALAALILNTPTAIVVFFAYKWVLPILFAIGSFYMDWFDSFTRWIDFQRAQGPLGDMSIQSASEWGQLVTSGLLWLGVPLFFGLRRMIRAEVK